MLSENCEPVNHPAQWLAESTGRKHPHLADVAQRGIEVITRGRIALSPHPAETTRATIANEKGEPYIIERVTRPNWQERHDHHHKGTPARPATCLTCTCPSYARGQYHHNGNPYCKHIWAEQASRTINALCIAFAGIIQAMTPPDPADCYWTDGLNFDAEPTPPAPAKIDESPTPGRPSWWGKRYSEMTEAEKSEFYAHQGKLDRIENETRRARWQVYRELENTRRDPLTMTKKQQEHHGNLHW